MQLSQERLPRNHAVHPQTLSTSIVTAFGKKDTSRHSGDGTDAADEGRNEHRGDARGPKNEGPTFHAAPREPAVEVKGLEPSTYGLQSRRSSS